VSDIEISPIEAADLPGILEIERASFSDPWSEKLFCEELDGDPRRLNAALRLEGRLVGYGLGWVVADEFHLGNLAIASQMRGRGYGKKLLQNLLNEAVSRGCRICSLEVRASNQAAIGLYRSLGFCQIALRRRYYGDEDALVMLAHLPVSQNA
jgi:ribosomal-protein-alanine N-acetyltransferase